MNIKLINDVKNIKIGEEEIQVKRINNDINGNPRYVVWWGVIPDAESYEEAVSLAKKRIAGRKYRGKDFGGGIVFQSYNIDKTLKDLIGGE